MKPNREQKQWLQEYLRGVLTYRETYEEVYDHVLSALENRPVQKSFEGMINDIIAADFGGCSGLMLLDDVFKNGVVTEIRYQYNSFFRWLKIPLVIYIIAAALIAYFAITSVKHVFFAFIPAGILHTYGYLLLLPVVMVIIPFLILAIRGFNIGYTFGDTKTSVKDSIFRRLAYLPVRVLFYWLAFEQCYHFIYYKITYIPHPFIYLVHLYILLIAAFILPIVHVTAFYKLYKNEMKLSISRFNSPVYE